MKKFSINCDFNGQMAPFTIYVGDPKPDHEPISFQANWLSKERGGTVPQEVLESLKKLKDLADKNGVSFEELCVYALGSAQEEEAEEAEEGGESPEEATEVAPLEENNEEEAPIEAAETEEVKEAEPEEAEPEVKIEPAATEEGKKDKPDTKEEA